MFSQYVVSLVTFLGLADSEGEKETRKWGNVVFVQIPTAEVYFPTQRYISRPQRWIFKLRPLGISHTTDQPGAKNLYSWVYWPQKQENEAGKLSRDQGTDIFFIASKILAMDVYKQTFYKEGDP